MREVLFFNGLGLVEWQWQIQPSHEVGGWGGVAVPLARSLDLLLMTHQARDILYLPCRICQLSGYLSRYRTNL